ncbi:MAG: alpha/beta fold hydrolase [Acidobacteriota bacterium]|nr:MAG: alpha/beta fold hydrolase [Acidobacteriota bacterium]
MAKTPVNDIQIYYEVEGDGPPLLLIYGLAGRGNGFRHQVPALSTKFKTISFDNRGVGETDQPEEPYSIAGMANDAAGLMDFLRIESAGVFGVSMGGMIAQELALRHPGRVTKLALGCTHSGIRNCVPSPKWVTEIFKTLPGKPRERAVRDSVPFNFSPHTQQHRPDLIEAEIERMIPNGQRLHAYENQVRAIYGFDAFDRLNEIRIPTLVLTGKDDVLIPPENSRMLAERIPGARLIEFDRAGHLFFIEQADQVNRALIDFF